MVVLLFSQPPVINWAGLAMGLLHVRIGDADGVLHHLQGAVPEQRLECE
jgi:hypothetical protein